MAVVDHLVVGLEAFLHVHPKLLFGQVADVAHRGADVETITQEPLQCPRLGGALDDDQTFRHSSSFIPIPAVVLPKPGLGAQSYARPPPLRNALT